MNRKERQQMQAIKREMSRRERAMMDKPLPDGWVLDEEHAAQILASAVHMSMVAELAMAMDPADVDAIPLPVSDIADMLAVGWMCWRQARELREALRERDEEIVRLMAEAGDVEL